MNCKQGDLAILTASNARPDLIGHIVEVLRPGHIYAEFGDTRFMWRCRFQREVDGFRTVHSPFRPPYQVEIRTNELDVADECLRPVSGLPDEQETEVTFKNPIKGVEYV